MIRRDLWPMTHWFYTCKLEIAKTYYLWIIFIFVLTAVERQSCYCIQEVAWLQKSSVHGILLRRKTRTSTCTSGCNNQGYELLLERFNCRYAALGKRPMIRGYSSIGGRIVSCVIFWSLVLIKVYYLRTVLWSPRLQNINSQRCQESSRASMKSKLCDNFWKNTNVDM